MADTMHHVVDPKFTYTDKRSGKPVVLYQGLLDAAHRAGMQSIRTEVLQFPTQDNDQTTIVRAFVFFGVRSSGEWERSYSGIGDANAKNVPPNIAPHAIRMAETRAKARALRDALNVGMVTVEELGGDYADDDGNAASKPAPRATSAPYSNGSTTTRVSAPPPPQRDPDDDLPEYVPPQRPKLPDAELLALLQDDLADPTKRLKAGATYLGRATDRDSLNDRYDAALTLPTTDRHRLYLHYAGKLGVAQAGYHPDVLAAERDAALAAPAFASVAG